MTLKYTPFLLILFFFIGACSNPSKTTPVDPTEKKPGLNDFEHFSTINEKKLSKITINEQLKQEAEKQGLSPISMPNDVAKNDSASNIMPQAPKINTATLEKINAGNSSKRPDLPTLNNKPNLQLTQESQQEKLAVSPNKDINAAARVAFSNLPSRDVTKKSNVLCNTTSQKFTTFNKLTKHIIDCQWHLPLILKINNIKSSDEFNANKKVHFPTAIYQNNQNQNLLTNTLSLDAINCDSYTMTIFNVEDLKHIAQKCQWSPNELSTINNIEQKILRKQESYTIILPPALPKLLEKYQEGAQSINDLKDTSAHKKSALKNKKIPNWCNQAYYITANNSQSINSIATQCALNKKLLANLNQLKTNQPIPSGSQIILPLAFKIKSKQKKYQIPFNPQYCTDKTYRIEYGISIGKIASTCQWNYKYLLRLNNLKFNAILNINDELIFPSSLSTRKTHAVTQDSNPSPKNNSVNYHAICNKNSYIFSVKDDLVKISQTCMWHISRLTIINDASLRKVTQGPQLILLPTIIDKIASTSKKAKKVTPQKKASLRKLTTICVQKKLDLKPTVKHLTEIKNDCSYDFILFNRLNATINGIKNSNHMLLPLSLYNNLGKLQEWVMPIEKKNFSSIYQKPQEKHTFYFQLNNSQTTIHNVQKGIITYVEKSLTNHYTVIIQHADSYTSVYSNLENFTHKTGHIIQQNEAIANIEDKTIQLKYQLFQNGKPVSFIQL